MLVFNQVGGERKRGDFWFSDKSGVSLSPSIAHFHGGLPHRRGMTHAVVDMVRPAKISPRPMFVLGRVARALARSGRSQSLRLDAVMKNPRDGFLGRNPLPPPRF